MLEMEEIDAWQLIQETIAGFRSQARKSKITLTKIQSNQYNQNNSKIFIYADKNKIIQVVRNLISNALKFTPPGGEVKAMIQIQTIDIDGVEMNCLVLDVIDTGVGLTTEQQEKLFKSVIQFNPGKLQNGGGSGLGLYVCQGIMGLHNGKLSVHSEGLTHGSTFSMIIPYIRLSESLTEELENKYDISSLRKDAKLWASESQSRESQASSFRSISQKQMFRSRGASYDSQVSGGSFSQLQQHWQRQLEHAPPQSVLPFRVMPEQLRSFSAVSDLSPTKSEILSEGDAERDRNDSFLSTAQKQSAKVELNFDRKLSSDTSSSSIVILPPTQLPQIQKQVQGYHDKQLPLPIQSTSILRDSQHLPINHRRFANVLMESVTAVISSISGGVSTSTTQDAIHPFSPTIQETKTSSSLCNHNLNDRNLAHRVLVADDMEISRKMTVRILGYANCDCDIAVDGQDAVNKLTVALGTETEYELVLMDYEMPNLTGPEAVRRMRTIGFRGKVVGVTGHVGAVHSTKFLACGANKVLVKPVKQKQLLALLDMNNDMDWELLDETKT